MFNQSLTGFAMNTTDFFETQKRANTQSSVWRIIFLITSAGIAFLVGQTGTLLFKKLMASAGSELPPWSIHLDLIISLAVFFIIILAFIGHSTALKKVGTRTLLTLTGARRVRFDSTDPTEKRLINVAQEIALASGTKLPELYILPNDESINAFTLDLMEQNAALVLTESATLWLTRTELQGVVAHEFAHILNSDVAVNTRFIPVVKSLLFITGTGWIVALVSPLLLMPIIMSILLLDLSAGFVLIFTAITISAALTGLLGKLTLILMQRIHSRTREWLADAAAVQYTRDPAGLRGALEKVDRNYASEIFGYKKLKQFEHMFFVSGHPRIFAGPLAIHPPLIDRIRALGRPDYQSPLEKSYFRVEKTDQPKELATESDTNSRHEGTQRSHNISDHATQLVNMSWALRAQNIDVQQSLTQAKKILYSAHHQFGEQLDTPEGITTIVFALAARLTAAKHEAIGEYLSPAQYLLLRDRFLPLFREFPFADCLAFVTLACLNTATWKAEQKQLLLNRIISLFMNDNEISPREISFILTLGNQLLTHNELQCFGNMHGQNTHQDLINLLAFVCHSGHMGDLAATQVAYTHGLRTLGLPAQTPPQTKDIEPEGLLRAIGRICTATDKLKRLYLTALLRAIFSDQKVNEDEFHVLRAVCTCLNVPMPLRASTGAG